MSSVTQINFLSIKPGRMDEFVEADRRYRESATLPKGVTSSRMYRSLDGASIVRVTEYESIEAHDEVHRDEGLRRQIATLRTLIESSNPSLYEEARAPGDAGSTQPLSTES